MYVHACVWDMACLWEHNSGEPILSCHLWDPGVKFRPSGLLVSSTHWAIWPSQLSSPCAMKEAVQHSFTLSVYLLLIKLSFPWGQLCLAIARGFHCPYCYCVVHISLNAWSCQTVPYFLPLYSIQVTQITLCHLHACGLFIASWV